MFTLSHNKHRDIYLGFVIRSCYLLHFFPVLKLPVRVRPAMLFLGRLWFSWPLSLPTTSSRVLGGTGEAGGTDELVSITMNKLSTL